MGNERDIKKDIRSIINTMLPAIKAQFGDDWTAVEEHVEEIVKRVKNFKKPTSTIIVDTVAQVLKDKLRDTPSERFLAQVTLVALLVHKVLEVALPTTKDKPKSSRKGGRR
jgi:adenosyl cobinamide kinase/adenosyl cobinamide phosphate guanylyltransferase